MATVRMPISRAARSTRTAISPRFAMRIFRNMARRALRLLHLEEPLPELDGAAGVDEALDDGAGELGFDFVHELHRFDDTERLTGTDVAADVHEGGRVRGGGTVESPDERRCHERDVSFPL